MRVAVAGGGIAGLTAAVALAAHGFEVVLFERVAEPREIGAGIQLSPNAMTVLERLGVASELMARVCEPQALVIRDAGSGAVLTRVPLGPDARSRYGAPYCTMHRADLQAALLATARRQPVIDLRLGAEVDEVRASDSVAFTAAGEAESFDVLVAADGIRSGIRQNHFRHPGPRPFGLTAWRALVPIGDAARAVDTNVVGLWLGAGAHLVHYPVVSGTRLNVVVIAAASHAVPPLQPFGGNARRLVETAPDWIASPLFELDPHVPWCKGRVALIGDAAHAMAPSAAQGGAQAIEDAWVLAAKLATDPTRPGRALANYESARRARVIKVARTARSNLNAYGLRGVPALLRNTVLRALPTNFALARLDWLFGWKPE